MHGVRRDGKEACEMLLGEEASEMLPSEGDKVLETLIDDSEGEQRGEGERLMD
jgi:hypothetical protein